MNVHVLMLGSFNPHARSHCQRSLPQIYRSQEMEKRRQYQERILNVDGGTFTPLVFSAMGGAGPAASTFLKCLADKIATKKSTTYAQALAMMVEMPLVVCPFAFKPPLSAWG